MIDWNYRGRDIHRPLRSVVVTGCNGCLLGVANMPSLQAGKPFFYVWFHVPTGKHGYTRRNFLGERDFLENLQRWNNSVKHYVYGPVCESMFADGKIPFDID